MSYIHISRSSFDSPYISDVEQLVSAIQYGLSCRVLCMLGGGDKAGCVDVSADVTVKSKHPRSTLRAGASMGAGAESPCRRRGEALVLVFVIVICFGDWLSVRTGLSSHHRCGVLGLFLVAF